jgi:hypothetical protein
MSRDFIYYWIRWEMLYKTKFLFMSLLNEIGISIRPPTSSRKLNYLSACHVHLTTCGLLTLK